MVVRCPSIIEQRCVFRPHPAAAFPIFGAWVANKTLDLRLPPLDNLLIMNTEADR